MSCCRGVVKYCPQNLSNEGMVLDAYYGWLNDHNREAAIRVKNYTAFCGKPSFSCLELLL